MLHDRRLSMMQCSPPPRSIEQQLTQAAYDPMTDSPTQGMMAKDYMQQLAGSMDSIKEVLTFLSAQDAMEIFASNPKAASLYRRIIGAGLNAVFHQRQGTY